MNEKTYKILEPDYMRRFKCIGPACEDSCCIGWQIGVDGETYKKLKKITEPELKKLIKKNIKPKIMPKGTVQSAEVCLKKDFSCPFLTEEKLCLIQFKKGESYLPNICYTFPRIYNKFDKRMEKSCILSCPEAARLALLNPEGITFMEMEEAHIRNNYNGIVSEEYLEHSGKPEKFFRELRDFTIRILQNRNYTLWQRVVILGTFYNNIIKVNENKIIDEIPNLIALYDDTVNKSSFKDNFSDIPSSYMIQMELLMFVTSKRVSQGVLSQRYLECFGEFLSGINYNPDSNFEKMTENYSYAYENYYRPFMDAHEYIFENYLVSYVFRNLFPLSGAKSMFDEYIILALHYSLLKMHLIGLSGFYKGLNTDIIIKLIQSYTKAIEHSSHFLEEMFNLIKGKGYTSMGYITLWLKN